MENKCHFGHLNTWQKRIPKCECSEFRCWVWYRWSLYSNHLNTGLVRYLNGRFVSGCQMVRHKNGGLKTGMKKILFMVQNVQYSNSPPSHVTLPFEYRTHILSGIQLNPVFMCSVFRWLLYFEVLTLLHLFQSFLEFLFKTFKSVRQFIQHLLCGFNLQFD